jgi:hypothetical protein
MIDVASPTTPGLFGEMYRAYVGGQYLCCDGVPKLDVDGRQLTFGPMDSGAGLLVSRKVFMPQSGAFVRYLDVVENATGVPMRVDVAIDAQTIADPETTRWTVLPEETGRTYMAMDDSWNSHQPESAALGHVMAGSGSVAAPARVLDGVESGFDNYAEFAWKATVPAHGRIAFLHYIVIRDKDQGAAAAAEAAALVDLADPEALAGLTADERGAIVNFLVP